MAGSVGAGTTLESREFSLFLTIFHLQFSQTHPHVKFHGVHVLRTDVDAE
jgi:hypothetical protein